MFFLSHQSIIKCLQKPLSALKHIQRKKTIVTIIAVEKSSDLLIDIAKEHPHSEVRKAAIFWLGETESEKALEVLVGILKEN